MGGVKRAHDGDVAVAQEAIAIHPSRKRRLDYSQADAQLAKIYNDLADDVQAVRIKAAGEVIRNLSANSDHQVERIEKAVATLRLTPNMGRPGRIIRTRELVVTRTPFIVPYRLLRERIEILAVIHAARRWPDSF